MFTMFTFSAIYILDKRQRVLFHAKNILPQDVIIREWYVIKQLFCNQLCAHFCEIADLSQKYDFHCKQLSVTCFESQTKTVSVTVLSQALTP